MARLLPALFAAAWGAEAAAWAGTGAVPALAAAALLVDAVGVLDGPPWPPKKLVMLLWFLGGVAGAFFLGICKIAQAAGALCCVRYAVALCAACSTRTQGRA